MRLTTRQREFAEAILNKHDPLDAAEIAGYSEPEITARRYKENKNWQHVRDWVAERVGTDEWKAETAAIETFEWLLNRLRLDFRDFFYPQDHDLKGTPKRIDQLSRAQAACIQSFEFKSWENGEQEGESLKIKLTPINKAIDQLHRLFGLGKETVDLNVHGEYQAAAAQLAPMFDKIRQRQQMQTELEAEAAKATD